MKLKRIQLALKNEGGHGPSAARLARMRGRITGRITGAHGVRLSLRLRGRVQRILYPLQQHTFIRVHHYYYPTLPIHCGEPYRPVEAGVRLVRVEKSTFHVKPVEKAIDPAMHETN